MSEFLTKHHQSHSALPQPFVLYRKLNMACYMLIYPHILNLAGCTNEN